MRILWALGLIGCLLPMTHAANALPPARLIDVHVHVWDPPPADPSFRDSLRAAFDTFHLERAVVSGPAELVPGTVALAPASLLGGFVYGAGYDLPPPAALRTLFSTRRLAVLGEVDSAWRGEPLDSGLMETYWALSEREDIPAFVFSGLAPPGTQRQPCCPRYRVRLGHPEQLEEVLARHPKLRVNLMQAGWPYRDETIALMHSYPEVYADLGNVAGSPRIPREEFYDYLRALMRAGLGKRLMFGSGLSVDEWPAKVGVVIAAIEDAQFLTADERADIFYNNAARFLRLSNEGAAKPSGR